MIFNIKHVDGKEREGDAIKNVKQTKTFLIFKVTFKVHEEWK